MKEKGIVAAPAGRATLPIIRPFQNSSARRPNVVVSNIKGTTVLSSTAPVGRSPIPQRVGRPSTSANPSSVIASSTEVTKGYLLEDIGVNASHMEGTRRFISESLDVIASPMEGIKRNPSKTPSVIASFVECTREDYARLVTCPSSIKYDNGKSATRLTSRGGIRNIIPTSVTDTIAKAVVSRSGFHHITPSLKTLCCQLP